ncbi:hypothetical protein Hamer_G012862 [Homarus americanus]|uniref:Uncharacterized protein n=1 Tax=Homarus americanus TaxID=6706 RepID=A0A8J5K5G4_HOMAM|nr:hypothetical protein Hamer_G012862 [Homarus americanus]
MKKTGCYGLPHERRLALWVPHPMKKTGTVPLPHEEETGYCTATHEEDWVLYRYPMKKLPMKKTGCLCRYCTTPCYPAMKRLGTVPLPHEEDWPLPHVCTVLLPHEEDCVLYRYPMKKTGCCTATPPHEEDWKETVYCTATP